MLDVIIPVKNRLTLSRCVTTLLEQIALVPGLPLGQIFLCDGGSTDRLCQQQLSQLSQHPKVQWLSCPHSGFNKSWLINQGLQATTADQILVSDVDILWNSAALQAMVTVTRSPHQLCYIATVEESEPQTVALQRPRYAYRLTQTSHGDQLELYLVPPSDPLQPLRRPGYGLVCAQRSLFQRIGGYRHDFQGWGWEDQDLLMRVQLLGYELVEAGSVIHLSHGDHQRNLSEGERPSPTPQQSRNRNICHCLAGLAQGRLLGDWKNSHSAEPQPTRSQSTRCLIIHCPPEFAHALEFDYPLSRSPAPSDDATDLVEPTNSSGSDAP